ncbi:hypothetical protein HPULCUR_004579 [Helicostylum pulchrum]|uniref:BD-FAE-like domain-containing protein n=1 Tax=Helicostylum pulchrum TaxID=562976 RepID=A0ABP9XWL6_9FUNG
MSTVKTFVAEKNVRNVTATEKKKTIYKNVLGSPFIIKWPTIHTELGQTILTQLLKVLTPIGEYKTQCRALKKEKKSDTATTLVEPDITHRTFIGINEVTRFMEHYIQNKDTLKPNATPVIYICKREIKPLQLCQHILYMAALAKVQLVPMPADSECKLGKALGMKRTSVLLIELMENKEESLRLIAKDIPFIEAPWLNNALNQPAQFMHDNVKILKTVAPTKPDSNTLKRKAEDGEATSVKDDKYRSVDLYLVPELDNTSPLVVLIHGGAWRSEDKSDYKDLALQFREKGFHTASINYRLSLNDDTSVQHPGHILDVGEGIEYLYQEYKNIYLVGHSAGAHIAAMLLLDTELSFHKYICGILGVSGIYDLPLILHDFPTYLDFVAQAFGTDATTYYCASATSKSSSLLQDKPIILAQSCQDKLINNNQTHAMFQHLKSMQANVTVDMSITGDHYEIMNFDNLLKLVQQLVSKDYLDI